MALKTITEHIREHLLMTCGYPAIPATDLPPLSVLRVTEWSEEFEYYSRNRLIMGAIRYGALHSPNKPNYDNVASMRKRLDLYEETGNAEHLVDVSNLCIVEFVRQGHPNFHFTPGDDGYHSPIKEETL